MLTSPKRLLLLALLVVQPYCMFSQTDKDTSSCNSFSCCAIDLTPSGVMISHVHIKNEWMISYRFMNMYMSDLTSGTQAKDKDDVFIKYLMVPEKMNMQMHMLMGMYGITNRLTAMVMLNYQFNSMEMTMYTTGHIHGGSPMTSPVHSMKTSGLGDTKLHLLYGIVQRNTCQLLVSLGASIPTGSIYLKGDASDPMYPNTHYPYGMQLGSGTVDILPGICYIFQKDKLAMSAALSGTYRGGYNSLQYKLGNESMATVWAAYKWLYLFSSTLRLEGNYSEQVKGYDPDLYYFTEPSTNPVNYGGKRVNAYIGSSLHFNGALKKNRLSIEYGIPLYQDLNGIQLSQKNMVNASWSFSF